MICSVCKKEMHISEGLTIFDNKRCHILCKKNFEADWRKKQGIDRF